MRANAGPIVQVIRIFGFSTAAGPEITCCKGRIPIQPAPFQYNEAPLQHYDFFVDQCAKVSMKQRANWIRIMSATPDIWLRW